MTQVNQIMMDNIIGGHNLAQATKIHIENTQCWEYTNKHTGEHHIMHGRDGNPVACGYTDQDVDDIYRIGWVVYSAGAGMRLPIIGIYTSKPDAQLAAIKAYIDEEFVPC